MDKQPISNFCGVRVFIGGDVQLLFFGRGADKVGKELVDGHGAGADGQIHVDALEL